MTTPMVRAPMSRAISAMTGAAPEPVPPPMPAVMKTRSESRRTSAIFSESSSAARCPMLGSPPAPRPRVILSPMRILLGASDCRRACASVLTAMNSTPISSARIMRLTALLPPPPTPMTRMRAKFSESERNGRWDPPRSRCQACCPPRPSHGRGATGPPGRRAGEYIPDAAVCDSPASAARTARSARRAVHGAFGQRPPVVNAHPWAGHPPWRPRHAPRRPPPG